MTDPVGWMARRPVLFVAVALILGIACHARLPHVVPLWIALAAVALVGGVLTRSRPVGSGVLLAGWGMAGVALGQLAAYQYPEHDVAHYTGEHRRLAQLELEIDEWPRIVAMNFGASRPLPPKQTCFAHVRAVKTRSSDWAPATGRVLVQIAEPHPELSAGQVVRVIGMLDRPAPAMNPGQFDWAKYYREQRVIGSIHVPHARNIRIIDRRPPSMHARWIAWTRATLAAGFDEAQSLDHALLRALVLGDSDPELRDVQEKFRATGTSHHLAISGMHIAVMGGFVFLVLRVLRVRPGWAWTLAMAFVLAYAAAALPSPPVIRSVLLWLTFGLAILMRRSIDVLHLLAIVVLAMLLYHPLDLFNAGFQLSFCTVLGLILLTGLIARWFDRRDEIDRLAKPHDHLLVRLAAQADGQIILLIASGLAAWLVSMPIIAAQFTQLNPWAVLSSIVLGPIVFAALIGGLLKIVLTAAFPSLAGWWAWGAQGPVYGMRWGVDRLAQLPWGDVPLPAPPWWVILAYFSLLLVAVRSIRHTGLALLLRLGWAASLFAMLVLPYRGAIAHQSSESELRVTLLSIGAGQCAVVEPPSKRVVLLDAGSISMSDPVRRCIGPFLRWRGITRIDTVAISHANTDHYSGVADLVNAYEVREVLTAHSFESALATSAPGQELLAELVRSERRPRRVAPGEIIPLGADTSLEVLWPPREGLEGWEANDQSLVVRLTHADRSILFTGDIQDAAMSALLRDPDRLKADVLVAPHHGSSESQTAAFVAAVGASIVLSSNDRTLSGKQMRFELLIGDRTLYRTHRHGAITVRVSADGQLAVEPTLEPGQ